MSNSVTFSDTKSSSSKDSTTTTHVSLGFIGHQFLQQTPLHQDVLIVHSSQGAFLLHHLGLTLRAFTRIDSAPRPAATTFQRSHMTHSTLATDNLPFQMSRTAFCEMSNFSLSVAEGKRPLCAKISRACASVRIALGLILGWRLAARLLCTSSSFYRAAFMHLLFLPKKELKN